MFDTYGPFQLKTLDNEGRDSAFEIIATNHPGLNSAVGIYIIATDDGSGNLTPWYVGMTTDEFGGRLFKGHFKGNKFVELANKSGLEIFLIALGNGDQFVCKSDVTDAQKIIVRQIEEQLIDRCYSRNPQLLNERLWSPTQIHVPGFIDKGDFERRDDPPKLLAKMLGM